MLESARRILGNSGIPALGVCFGHQLIARTLGGVVEKGCGEYGRGGVVTGELRAGDGGFNKPWSRHLDPGTARVADLTIELCDGMPSFAEAELDYWLNVVKRYCPWSGRVVAEEPWHDP
ncbi:MAG: glutamine amidotransferase-related protein [Thermosphaera aggregans]|uniref:BP74-related protein n=1 Tax=Thermosphaera aggregans TaxID=54254 RepID=UPI003C0EE2E2